MSVRASVRLKEWPEQEGLHPPVVIFLTGIYWIATDGIRCMELGTSDEDLPIEVHPWADLVYIDDGKILEINTDLDGEILRVRRW